MHWTLLRKGGTLLHVAYGGTFTNSLHGHRVRVRTEPSTELALDLEPNLRTPNKSANSYRDARELADGRIADLTLVQLSDDYIIENLCRVLDVLEYMPREWGLVIELGGARHAFQVRPESTGRDLFLYVIPQMKDAVEAGARNAEERTVPKRL